MKLNICSIDWRIWSSLIDVPKLRYTTICCRKYELYKHLRSVPLCISAYFQVLVVILYFTRQELDHITTGKLLLFPFAFMLHHHITFVSVVLPPYAMALYHGHSDLILQLKQIHIHFFLSSISIKSLNLSVPHLTWNLKSSDEQLIFSIHCYWSQKTIYYLSLSLH